jgi:type IV pilus assembly protein PilN
MMIRINLLPVRQVQKREQGRQFLVLLIGTLVFAGAANGYWYMWADGKRVEAQRKLDATVTAIEALKKTIGVVNDLERRKKEVKEKLDVLNKLTSQRTGPVKVLDALSTAIPKKVQLGAFDEKGGAATMQGVAESFDDVSEFMRGLNNIVWTPKGMGRVVERKRDGSGARVELFNAEAAIDEFSTPEIAFFFSNIELKQTTTEGASSKIGPRTVKFEMSLAVNLAI